MHLSTGAAHSQSMYVQRTPLLCVMQVTPPCNVRTARLLPCRQHVLLNHMQAGSACQPQRRPGLLNALASNAAGWVVSRRKDGSSHGSCHMLSHMHVAESGRALHFDNHAAVAEHVINNGSTRVWGCPTLQYAAKDGCACFSTTL